MSRQLMLPSTRMFAGRLLHAARPATEKALDPNQDHHNTVVPNSN